MPILPQTSGQILELGAHPTQLPVAGAFYLYSVAGVVYRMDDTGVYTPIGGGGGVTVEDSIVKALIFG